MRVPTGVMDGSALRPLIRHLLRKCHLPPCGGKALRAATWGRPYGGAPVRSLSLRGGPQARRGNPSLRPKRNGFPRPLRGLGMTGRAHAVRPYMAAGRSPPHPALRATFPPGGRYGAPSRRAPRKRSVLIRRGRCPHRPTGGHMGPPLRRRKLHIVRFPLTGKAPSFRCSDSPHRTRGCRRWASAGAP